MPEISGGFAGFPPKQPAPTATPAATAAVAPTATATQGLKANKVVRPAPKKQEKPKPAPAPTKAGRSIVPKRASGVSDKEKLLQESLNGIHAAVKPLISLFARRGK